MTGAYVHDPSLGKNVASAALTCQLGVALFDKSGLQSKGNPSSFKLQNLMNMVGKRPRK